ncbi:MAG: outer membrane beta-barrel protein, partial [Bacteroidetes bacterium]|nr:outer membrane beta-barrel protein [Bacteroidota bacterium]
DLKPSFANRFSMYFNDYKLLSQRGIWVSASYYFTNNAITSSTTVDNVGKRVSQFVNVNGNYSMYANLGYEFKWKKPNINFDFSGNVNKSANVSYVNSLLNKTNSNSYSISNGMWYSKEKKIEIGLRSSATYTQSRSSINTGIKTDYWTYNIQPNTDFFLPAKFQIHADADINLRQKTSVFDRNNNVVLLNAWIGKKFLKNDALLVKLQGNDILNQNLGFNRTVNSNFITQNTYSTIRRYFMLYFVWNFTKPGTPAPTMR